MHSPSSSLARIGRWFGGMSGEKIEMCWWVDLTLVLDSVWGPGVARWMVDWFLMGSLIGGQFKVGTKFDLDHLLK